ncbi:uncharacterized protein LOC134237441 [Saccostrea cucullata]|uniref:uncharacterized protein LOC134237441 n=1 Tax=Saccostrea cuccullata TaxID=36930 RepID=UPI002ED05830
MEDQEELGCCFKCCSLPVAMESDEGEDLEEVLLPNFLDSVGGLSLPNTDGLCRNCSDRHRKTYSTKVDIEDDVAEFFKLSTEDIEERIECDTEQCSAVSRQTSGVEESLVIVHDVKSPLQSVSEQSSQNSEFSLSQSSQGTVSDYWRPPTYHREKLNRSMEILSDGKFTPLRFTLNASLDEVQQSTKDYVTQKANEVIQYAFECIAPGQENALMHLLYQKYYKPEEKRVETDALTEALIKAYDQADGHQSQVQILSLFVNNFSKTELCKMVHGLTKYKIDCARKYASTNGPGQIIDQPKINRIRLTKCRIQHFVEFLCSPSICQVVGYGSKTLRLSSGLQIKIPKMIRTMIASRIIHAYEMFCEDSEMVTPSRATLFKIIKVCSASQKKSLKGLDSYTADGMEAVELLQKILYKLQENGLSRDITMNLIEKLSDVNEHLKFDLKMHVTQSSTCIDHCTTYALSDETNPDFSKICDHQHTESCMKCSSTAAVIDEISSCLSATNLSIDLQRELEHDFERSRNNIQEWKAHITRTVNQDISKCQIVQNMKSNQALLILDWAMKFLPQSFRESQQNWFGKQGISWHVTCAIFLEHPRDDADSQEKKFSLVSFVHVLQGGNQGWFSVACILKNSLEKLKCLNPHLSEVYLKSDNAGCYHSMPLMSYIWRNYDFLQLKIREYNFSEVQSGKDLCDSRTGTCRMHILKYANEGNDVENADQLKKALESHGGVKNTFITLIDISTENHPVLSGTIRNFKISQMNNFVFEEEGIRVFRAYGIGPGHLIPKSTLEKISQNLAFDETKMKVKEDSTVIPECMQSSLLKLPFASPQSDEQDDNNGDLSCTEPGCIRSFRKPSTLEKHLAVGSHSYHETNSSTDIAMELWAEQCSQSLCYNQSHSIQSSNASSESQLSQLKTGWALKSDRKFVRFSTAVKQFVKNIFDEGEKTGKKANPVTVSLQIRNERDENGNHVFCPNDWISAQQVRSLFAQFQMKLLKESTDKEKRPKLELTVKSEEDEDLNEVLKDLNAMEAYDMVNSVTDKCQL